MLSSRAHARIVTTQDVLARSERLHPLPPAMDKLYKLGARQFAWLKPYEDVGVRTGEWPHGAFVFIYDPELSWFDCVFKLVGVHDEQADFLTLALSRAQVPIAVLDHLTTTSAQVGWW